LPFVLGGHPGRFNSEDFIVRKILTFECDAYRRFASDSYRVDSGPLRGKKMPLLPYLPMIIWIGMIQVALGATLGQNGQGIDDPGNLTTHRGSIVPFPTPLPLNAA